MSRASSSSPSGCSTTPSSPSSPSGCRRARTSCSPGASRRRGARAPSSAGARRRPPTCSGSARALLAFYGQHEHRKLTLAVGPARRSSTGSPAPITSRLAPATAMPTARSSRCSASATSWSEREGGARARPRPARASSSREIEEAAPDPAAEERSWRPSATRLRHVEALRRAAAAALLAVAGGEEGGGAAAGARRGRGSARRAPASVDPALDELAERARRPSRRGTPSWPHELRDYAEGIEAEPGRLDAGRGAPRRRSTGSSASTAARSRPCSRTPSAAARSSRGWTGDGARSRSSAPSSRRRRRSAPELAAQAEREPRAGRAEARAAGRRRARGAGDGRRSPRGCLRGDPRRVRAGGQGAIEFRVATNPGMPIAPLRDAASGGELSRVMLALSGLGAGGRAATLVFDEIDAGIGGARRAPRRRAAARASATSARSSASRTFPRSPPWPPPTSGSRRTRRAHRDRQRRCRQRRRAARRDLRMLGADRDDEAASRPRARVARGLTAGRQRLHNGGDGEPRRSPRTRSRGADPAAATGGRARSASGAITGPPRLGRKTKDLVKRLEPGEVAVIDHADLDRVAAEELVACGAPAVINVAASRPAATRTSGR